MAEMVLVRGPGLPSRQAILALNLPALTDVTLKPTTHWTIEC